jgi:Domain of unknown function (DUF6249)
MHPEFVVVAIFVVIPIMAMATGILLARFKTQERLRAIEKGVPLPPELAHAADRWDRAAGFRVAGMITMAAGLGLLILFGALAATVPGFAKGVIAIAAIPILIGAALLIEHRVRVRELKEREQTNPRGQP